MNAAVAKRLVELRRDMAARFTVLRDDEVSCLVLVTPDRDDEDEPLPSFVLLIDPLLSHSADAVVH